MGSLKASPPVSFQIVTSTRVTKGFQFYKLELNQGHSYIDIFPRIQLYFVNGSAKHRIIIVLRVLYDLGHAPEFSFECEHCFFLCHNKKQSCLEQPVMRPRFGAENLLSHRAVFL